MAPENQPLIGARRTKLESFHVRSESHSHTKAAVCAAYSFDGALLATASADKTAEIIGTNDFSKRQTLEGCHTEGLNACCWLDDRIIVTASDDEKVVLWDVEMGKALLTMEGHTSYVYSLAVNPKNRVVYSGGYDGSLVVFDVTSGSKIVRFDAHADSVSSIDYSIQRDTIVTGSHDGMIRFWDGMRPSSCMASIVNKAKTPVSNTLYSPNGDYLIASTLDSTHRLYRIANDNPLMTDGSVNLLKSYRSHSNQKYSIFSAMSTLWDDDSSSVVGSYLASGSEDNKLYLWDLNGDEKALAVALEGSKDVILAVACHPDPRVNQIATASRDGTVMFWDTHPRTDDDGADNHESTENQDNPVVHMET